MVLTLPQAIPGNMNDGPITDHGPYMEPFVESTRDNEEMPISFQSKGAGPDTTYMSMPSRSSTSDHFFEDFEGYSYGQYLNDSGKWTYHNDYDFGKATAIANPFSSLTPKCGMNVNPSLGGMDQGTLLSPVLDIEKGTLELWMASDHIDPSNQIRTVLFLFGTDSGGPDLVTDKMIKVGFNYGTISYQNTDWGDITGFADTNKWYHLEISFDCNVQKCDIRIMDAEGTELGSAYGVDLANGFNSVRRVGLVTGPQINSETTISYWDDLLIESIDTDMIETDERGGSWYDSLKGTSGVSKVENADRLASGGFITYPPSTAIDDFESYSEGESIVGKNGWTKHTVANVGSALATMSRPFPGLTGTTVTHHNPESSVPSIILSKELFLTDCRISLWAATSLVDPTDHTTSQIYMLGSMKNDATTADRLGMISFTHYGIEYGNGQSYFKILNGASKETWYNVIIDLDFTLKKMNVTIKNTTGGQLASVTDLPFWNSFPMLKRIGLSAGRQTSYQFITSYWDDIKILNEGSVGKGYVETIPLELPPGCEWTNLRIDKSEVGGSTVRLRILDAGTISDTGLLFDNSSSQIDISGLNDLGVSSIVLNATLTSTFRDPAALRGWGVEWEKVGAFRDSFLTSKRLYRKEKTVAELGHIRMMDGRYEGQVMSAQLELPDSSLVPTLFLDTPLEGPTAVNVHLVKRDNFTEVGIPIDKGNGTYLFHSIDRGNVDRVMLVMDIRSAIKGPILRSWSLVGLPNNAPDILGLHAPPLMNRTQGARIGVTVNDLDQPGSLLNVELMYLPPGGTTWETEDIKADGFVMTRGEWEFSFNTKRTTPVGPFSLKVRVKDEHGSIVEKVYEDMITVVNNRPTRPDIALSPTMPFTDTVIEASILNGSMDVEDDILLYTFEWYVNGAFEHREENLSLTTSSELSGSRFMKHDIVRCEVFSYDGLDWSDRGFAEVEILNSPPRRVEPYLKSVEYNEDEPDVDGFDLSRWVLDPDSDRLTYTIEGHHEIEMSVDDEGVLWVETRKDWFGNETVTVSVADQESRMIFDLTVVIRPVNDMPLLESIDYEGIQAYPVMGDIPYTFDVDGKPVDWTQGRRIDVRFQEEKIVPMKVNAKDIETEKMDYKVQALTNVPFALVQDTISGSTVTIIPEKDAFGEYWIGLDVDDGEGGIISALLCINITNTNDLPTGFIVNPADGQAKGEVGVNLTFSARVTDVDMDVLVVTWSVGPEVLATGETVDIMWMVPGIYYLECKVMDAAGPVSIGFVEVNITARPIVPGNDPAKNEFPVVLVIIAAVLLLLIFVIGTFFILRSMKRAKEEEGKEQVPKGPELPALSAAHSTVDGQMLALGMSSPAMTGTLPPAGGSMMKAPLDQGAEGEPVISGELPPASIDLMVQEDREIYIRPQAAPQRPVVESGMMSAPLVGSTTIPPSGIVRTGQANLAPVPDMQDDMMKVGSPEGPPQVEETVFHDSEDHVWTPAMAESRAATESKGAVDLLRELNELKEKGALSEEEFDVSKRRLLRKI
jgi:hypothetical protein